MDVLLDTHIWAWSMGRSGRLRAEVAGLLTGTANILVSPVTLFEIGQVVRRGKWPEMAPRLGSLLVTLEDQGGQLAHLSADAALLAAAFDWPHRDPFDRLIAATAIDTGAALVTADRSFATLDDPRFRVVWN